MNWKVLPSRVILGEPPFEDIGKVSLRKKQAELEEGLMVRAYLQFLQDMGRADKMPKEQIKEHDNA